MNPEQQTHTRKPFRNFFIKKSVQFKLVFQIFFTILLTATITTVLISIHYISKADQGSFFLMSNDGVMLDLKLVSMLGIVLPALIIAQTISIVIALAIGLFSSRKIAVPLYKIENWASRIRSGKLNTTLAFREKKEMKELTFQCNAATDFFRNTLEEIRSSARKAGESENPAVTREEIQKILNVLQKIEF
ncbi:MAG: hypothetical protein ACLFVQ_03700 [Chitinispirillaceae bacterium]